MHTFEPEKYSSIEGTRAIEGATYLTLRSLQSHQIMSNHIKHCRQLPKVLA